MRFIALLIVIYCFGISCKKSNPEGPTDEVEVVEDYKADEPLSASQLALIDALPIDSTTALADLYFNDSTSIKDFLYNFDRALHDKASRPIGTNDQIATTFLTQKKLFVSRMIASALTYTDRSKYVFKDEGPDKPGQYGIAYSFGSKDFTKRKQPVGACNAKLSIHGIDCSGFIYQVGLSSRLELAPVPDYVGTQFLGVEKNWNEAFKNSVDYKRLKMKYVTATFEDLEPGDIVLWPGSHVGIIMNELEIIQSSGYGNVPDAPKTCLDNFATWKGPAVNTISEKFLNDFGKNWKVLRITADCDEGGAITVHRIFERNGLGGTAGYMVTGGYTPYDVTTSWFPNAPYPDRNTDAITKCLDPNVAVTPNEPGWTFPIYYIYVRDSRGTMMDTLITYY